MFARELLYDGRLRRPHASQNSHPIAAYTQTNKTTGPFSSSGVSVQWPLMHIAMK